MLNEELAAQVRAKCEPEIQMLANNDDGLTDQQLRLAYYYSYFKDTRNNLMVCAEMCGLTFNAASKAIRRPEVIKKCHEFRALWLANNGITADRIIEEMAQLAFYRATDYVNIVTTEVTKDNGDTVYEADLEFTDTAELKARGVSTAPITSIKKGRNGVEISFADKRQALVDLGKWMGLHERLNVSLTGADSGPIKISTDDQKQNIYKKLLKVAGNTESAVGDISEALPDIIEAANNDSMEIDIQDDEKTTASTSETGFQFEEDRPNPLVQNLMETDAELDDEGNDILGEFVF